MPKRRKDFTLSDDVIGELSRRKSLYGIPASRQIEDALRKRWRKSDG